ncbi:MAG: PD-(D/E)XK nuclease family protein [Ferrimicrobium sp.]
MANTAKRPGTIAFVDEDASVGTSTETLISRLAGTQARLYQLDQWLHTRADVRSTQRERVKATLLELDRFDVTVATLAQAGYHGKKMASLLSDFQNHFPSVTRDESIVSGPHWTRARLGFDLLSEAEIADLASAGADHALLTIAKWRSPDLDPASARVIKGLTRDGFDLRGHFDDHPQVTSPTQIYHFTDPDQEVSWTLAEILARLHTGAFRMQDLVIYLPNSRHYHRALRHYSRAYRLPLILHQQRQASQTTLGRHLLELLDLLQVGHVVGSAHRSRLLANLIADQAPPDTWDRLLEWLLELLDKMMADPNASAQINSMDQTLRAELFAHLQPSLPTTASVDTLSQFLDAVRDRLGAMTLAEKAGTEGITVANTGQPIGQHRIVFVLGGVDRHLPPELSNNPLLPLAIRDRVDGLPTTAELVQWQRAQAIGMFHAATEELIITAPQRIENERTLASLLLEELGLQPTSAPPPYGVLPMERVAFDTTHPEIKVRRDLALAIERSRIRNVESSDFSGKVGPLAFGQLSATQLEDLGQCPFRWFVKHRLRVRAPDDETNEPDPRTLGQLVHTLLETLVTTPEPVPRQVLEELLEQHAPVTLTKYTPNWLPIRAEIAKQLETLVANPEFSLGALGTQVELALNGYWHEIPVQGRIDRLDHVGPNDYAIIDYKFSKSVPTGIQDAEGRLKVDVQLSVYTQLVEGQGKHVVGAKYCLVKRGTFVKAPGITKGEEPAKEAAARLLTRLENGDFAVAPDIDRKACTYCDFAQTCRIASRNAG